MGPLLRGQQVGTQRHPENPPAFKHCMSATLLQVERWMASGVDTHRILQLDEAQLLIVPEISSNEHAMTLLIQGWAHHLLQNRMNHLKWFASVACEYALQLGKSLDQYKELLASSWPASAHGPSLAAAFISRLRSGQICRCYVKGIPNG